MPANKKTLSYRLSHLIQRYERWLLNVIYAKQRLTRVNLSDCIDEVGHSFGPNGNHFMIGALQAGEDRATIASKLREYYAHNHMLEFNAFIGFDSNSPIGHMYFTPWEDGRIRPLANFLGSHRAGPTSETTLSVIVDRLMRCRDMIKTSGYKQLSIPDGIIRIYTLVDRNGTEKHVVRDGQHRCCVLSYLGYKDVLTTYETTYYRPSGLRRLFNTIRGKSTVQARHHVERVYETDVSKWPHVKNGNVTEQAALAFFNTVFKGTPLQEHETKQVNT